MRTNGFASGFFQGSNLNCVSRADVAMKLRSLNPVRARAVPQPPVVKRVQARFSSRVNSADLLRFGRSFALTSGGG
jgi:hypothetical protein